MQEAGPPRPLLHFGSRGIPIMSVFQPWSQGIAVFGRDGMLKLFSATNAFLYLGGVRENDFLQNLTELIGDYDRETTTASMKTGIRSTSTALKRERILGVVELAALPRGRAILLPTGTRAALLRTVPRYQGAKPTTRRIHASISAHDPGTLETGTQALQPPPATQVVQPGARSDAAPDA
jgi:hypothetical protein